MGSFNEVCALSNLNIPYGTPVRLLFLTQNPYVESDQREQQRGCYHYDQWFVRTPPIKGEYADYGDCEFKETPITKLVTACFQDDVVERPYGFNQYHAGPVAKGKDLQHYLAAAWQGRLLIADEYSQGSPVPEHFPTWQRLHAILKKGKVKLQCEMKGEGGYNAQPVRPGVVCVTYNSYSNEEKKLKAIEKLILATYDCKLVYKFEKSKNDPCLLVVPKDAFNNPSNLLNMDELNEALKSHPELDRNREPRPCLAVMVREDVWQVYLTTKIEKESWRDIPTTVPEILKKLKKACVPDKFFLRVCDMAFRDTLHTIPFQTMASTHIVKTFEDKKPKGLDELLLACAELAKVELVMSLLHHSWYIPSLGGQEGQWEMRTKLLKKIAAISDKQWKQEKDENPDEDD